MRPEPSTRSAGGVLDGQELGPEPARLVGRATRQIRPAQSGREPQVVLDPARLPGLSAGRLAFDHDRLQSLRRAVDRRAQTGRAAADDHQVVVLGRRLSGDAESLGELEHRRTLEHGPVLEQRHRQPILVEGRHLEELASLRVALDVEPSRRHQIAGQEVAQVVRRTREAVPDQPHPARLQGRARLPSRQQILDDREQLLLGRVPRLEQVVIERYLIDGLDRRLGVRVRGQQHALGGRDDLARAHEVVGALHARHPLVGYEQGNLLAAPGELAQRFERLLPRAGAHDPVALAEPPPQVA